MAAKEDPTELPLLSGPPSAFVGTQEPPSVSGVLK